MAQLIGNRDLSKIILETGRTRKVTYKNLTGAAITLVRGEVIATIGDGGANSGKSVIVKTDATDGSQFPVGINMKDVVALANNGEVELTVMESGVVNESKLVLRAGQTLNDIISLRTLRQRLASDTLGIKCQVVNELTNYDNQ